MAQRHMLICILPSVFQKLTGSAPLNTKKEHACVVIHHTKKMNAPESSRRRLRTVVFHWSFVKFHSIAVS